MFWELYQDEMCGRNVAGWGLLLYFVLWMYRGVCTKIKCVGDVLLGCLVPRQMEGGVCREGVLGLLGCACSNTFYWMYWMGRGGSCHSVELSGYACSYTLYWMWMMYQDRCRGGGVERLRLLLYFVLDVDGLCLLLYILLDVDDVPRQMQVVVRGGVSRGCVEGPLCPHSPGTHAQDLARRPPGAPLGTSTLPVIFPPLEREMSRILVIGSFVDLWVRALLVHQAFTSSLTMSSTHAHTSALRALPPPHVRCHII